MSLKRSVSSLCAPLLSLPAWSLPSRRLSMEPAPAARLPRASLSRPRPSLWPLLPTRG